MKLFNIKALHIGSLLTLVAGGGLSGIFAFRSHDPASWGMAIMSLAMAVKSMLPAASVVADAPVKDNAGAVVGVNVSTSSTKPIVAPHA